MRLHDIADIAVTSVVHLCWDESIKTAIDTITEKQIRNLLIHDPNYEHYSILSVGDIVDIVTHHIDLDKPISTVKLKPLTTCSKHTKILEAIMLFGDKNAIIGVLDDDGKLIGIATHSNVLNAIYGEDDDSFTQPIKTLLEKESAILTHKGENLNNCLERLDTSTTDCLIVLDGEAPCGIITKRDIVMMLSKNISLDQAVENLMSSPLKTVHHSLTINNALSYMHDEKLKRVIVVDDHDRLEGVVTQKDILEAIYTKLAQKGFFTLGIVNNFLQDQVNAKTLELQNLNKELELRVQKATEELRQSERNLAEMRKSEALFELLRNLAHHWRQPLSVIMLMAQVSELLLTEDGKNDMIKANLRHIISETQDLSATIDKMTNLYKENGQGKAILIDLKSIADKVLSDYQDIDGVQIVTNYDISPSGLKISPSTLSYIINELIGNSIAAAINNKKDTLNLTFKLHEVGKNTTITITDDAGGIEPEKLESIFDPYFTTEFKSKNKGLGLHLLKNIVEKSLGGKVTANNTANGVMFEIKVPNENPYTSALEFSDYINTDLS